MYSIQIVEHSLDEPAWWRVDLGALYDVYEVVIVNRDIFQGICLTDRKGGNKDRSLMQLSK